MVGLWFINVGVVLGRGSIVPEAITEKRSIGSHCRQLCDNVYQRSMDGCMAILCGFYLLFSSKTKRKVEKIANYSP